ncbi:hypothetical protein EK904_008016 [Melospiza melodia maxima]|nr:hypothetical protein EK904_008016 [Melospiza melodia maxima]
MIRQVRAKENQGNPCSPRPLRSPVKSTDTVLRIPNKSWEKIRNCHPCCSLSVIKKNLCKICNLQDKELKIEFSKSWSQLANERRTVKPTSLKKAKGAGNEHGCPSQGATLGACAVLGPVQPLQSSNPALALLPTGTSPSLVPAGSSTACDPSELTRRFKLILHLAHRCLRFKLLLIHNCSDVLSKTLVCTLHEKAAKQSVGLRGTTKSKTKVLAQEYSLFLLTLWETRVGILEAPLLQVK